MAVTVEPRGALLLAVMKVMAVQEFKHSSRVDMELYPVLSIEVWGIV